MCLDDKFKKFKNSINNNKYLIFVGSNFFGNTTGLDWYVKNIANNINKGWGLVEDEKIKKYLDDLQRVTNSTIKNNQYLKIL